MCCCENTQQNVHVSERTHFDGKLSCIFESLCNQAQTQHLQEYLLILLQEDLKVTDGNLVKG